MAVVGTGITLTMVGATSFFAEITDITPPAMSRESLDTSHQGTVKYKTFTPSLLIDSGELKVDLLFDPSLTPPIEAAPSSCVLTFPDTGTTTWTFNGFLTNYEPTGSLDKLMTCSCTIKVTGKVTIANP
jgi:hypothetical protein